MTETFMNVNYFDWCELHETKD